MSKIARYQGNVRAFASDAQGMERTVFGGTNQADDLTSQITASFLRGWGIVGASEHPSLEDFNAAMYAMSQFIAYQHQMGVPEWHAEQEYHIGSICTHNGESYQSLQNANIGSQPPSAKWTPVLTSKNGLANLGIPNPFVIQERSLPATTDLNTLGGDGKQGIYSQPTHASATLEKHYPDTVAGTLLVLPSAFGGMQVYITYNGAIWQRQVSNNWNGSGPWGIWIKTPSISDLNNKQPLDSTLTAIAALNGSANKLPYFTGSESAGLTDLTSFARTLLSRNTGEDVLSDLGLSSGFGWVNLPGGKIIQWNRGNTGDGGNRFTFPIPFPHQCHGVVANPFMTVDGSVINAGSSISTIFVSSATISNTGFFAKYAAGASRNEFFWFAIGE